MYDNNVWDQVDGAGYLTAMAQGIVAEPAHFARLGLRVVDVETGSVRLQWCPTEDLLNPHGVVHGGFVAAALDVVAGLSAATTFPRFVHLFTLEMRIDFIRPIAVGGGPLEVAGATVRRGRRTLLADGRVGSADAPFARAAATFVPNKSTVPPEKWPAAGL